MITKWVSLRLNHSLSMLYLTEHLILKQIYANCESRASLLTLTLKYEMFIHCTKYFQFAFNGDV